jgi:hypothetical protein
MFNTAKQTIQTVTDSFSGRVIPKRPLTFLVYGPGEIIPHHVGHQADVVLSDDDILHIVETKETFQKVGHLWGIVGTTDKELAALLMTELVK